VKAAVIILRIILACMFIQTFAAVVIVANNQMGEAKGVVLYLSLLIFGIVSSIALLFIPKLVSFTK
jgi:hypothetical protein